jgi:hypothetical protein
MAPRSFTQLPSSDDGGGQLKKIPFLILWSILSSAQCFAGILINGGLSQEHTLQPGAKTEGKITVRNTGEAPVQVKIYQTDYVFSADGKSVYGAPGSMPRSNAGWISLSPGQLSVGPKEAATAYYTIQVPEKLAFPGTYWSIVMVEPVAEAGLQGSQGEKDRLRIQTVIRYGVQIVTDVGTSAVRQIRFLDKKFIYDRGQKILQLDIENTGESWLSPSVWVDIYGKDGQSKGRFEGSRMRIYPGCSIRQSIDLTKIPPGEYRVLVVVDNEDGFAVGAQYDLVVE